MVKMARMMLAMTLVTILGISATAGIALAVDPPKWVAAMFIEAQKVVGLRWAPLAGATGYKVLRSTTPGKDYKEIGAPPTTQLMDKDVEAGSTYYYVLQAVAGAEVSATSEEKSVTIPGQKVQAVNVPVWDKANLNVSTEFGKTTYKVGLFWKPVPEAIAYNVYRTLESGKNYELLSSTQDPKIVDEKVEAGKTYYYTVTALDANFQETAASPENKILVKAPDEVKAVKAVLKANTMVMKSVKEIARITGGASNTLFSPGDIVISSRGDVYVVNALAGVSVFSSDGAFKFKFGKTGSGVDEIGMGFGMGIDADDNIYVADGRKILMFDDKGLYKNTFTIPLPTDQKVLDAAQKGARGQTLKPTPVDVAEASNGDLLVTDNVFGRVVVIDKKGNYVTEFGSLGNDPGQLANPGGIAVNSKGEIWVNDSGNRRGSVFTPDYKLKFVAGLAKSFVGAFLGMQGVTVNENDDFLVTDPPMSTFQTFSAVDGSYLFHYADEAKTVEASSKGQRPLLRISNPAGIGYDKKNRIVYVTLSQMSVLWIVQVLDK